MSALLDDFGARNAFSVQLNTGTLLDLTTGKYQLGYDNKYYLNGGLGLTTGIAGRGNSYKSGLAGSLMVRAMLNYENSDSIVYESEFSIADASRYDDLSPPGSIPVSQRILFINPSQMNFGEWFELAKEYGEKKIKKKSDYTVETPFLDPYTGKRARMLVPTFMMVDSFSKATGSGEADRYEDNKVDSDGMNMLFMQDGKLKTLINRQMPNMAMKYGMYFMMTAHVKDQNGMSSGPTPPPKEMQFMKQRDKLSGVGTDFEFLTTTFMQNWGAKALQDSNKRCLYPWNDSSPDLEIQSVPNIMLRCKNNASGTQLNWIMSQYAGLQNEITNFELLKLYKNFGMTVNGSHNFRLLLKQDPFFHRTTIRDLMSKDYQLGRALELTAQLCYIQNHWFLPRLPEIVKIPIESLAEKLLKHTNPTISDILNTTGCWTYGKSERPYMSLFDILTLVQEVK